MLIDGIFKYAERTETFEFSFEGHPNNTTTRHLETLYDLGFRRVSFGIQDYAPHVQRAIHRVQPFENVREVTEAARGTGYTSVSHDLVFGLPFQTQDDVSDTIAKTILLKPDRIALYSYAHVPWMGGNGQRGFREEDLPTGKAKRKLYETARKRLEEAGYTEIGMDHFAWPSDPLSEAMDNGRLHRNFMGYTTTATSLMIGLGVSAISDSWYGFAQNVKSVEEYTGLLQNDILPIHRGHILDTEDLVIRRHILNLMCGFHTSWKNPDMQFDGISEVLKKLEEPLQDGLIHRTDQAITVTPEGRPFIRNICMAFDLRLQRNKPGTRLFSSTV